MQEYIPIPYIKLISTYSSRLAVVRVTCLTFVLNPWRIWRNEYRTPRFSSEEKIGLERKNWIRRWHGLRAGFPRIQLNSLQVADTTRVPRTNIIRHSILLSLREDPREIIGRSWETSVRSPILALGTDSIVILSYPISDLSMYSCIDCPHNQFGLKEDTFLSSAFSGKF